MALIDLLLQRRNRIAGSPVSARRAHLNVETLEARECLSVAAPGLQLAAVSSTQVKLTWTNVANESGYRVFRWDGTKSIMLNQLAKDVTTVTVGNLAPHTTQWFSVEAFNASASARSAWASIITPPDPITVPTNLKVGNATNTTISLSWTDSIGETGYRIFGWNGTAAVQLGAIAANSTSFMVQNLTPGTTYYFYVQAFNGTNAKSTGWVTAQTTASLLTAPTNLKATPINANKIGLSWNDATGEAGYRVYGWNGSNSSAPVLLATLGANVTGYQATGLLPGKTYWFYVQAFNGVSSANSVWVQATTPAAAPLAPPGNVTIQATGSNSVLISWNQVNRAAGYRVHIWMGTYWAVYATVPAGTGQVSVTGLLSNYTHWFTVQSFTDNFAEVAYSNAVFVNL